jgi:hypothetical protein
MGSTLYTGKSSAAIMYKQVTERVDLGRLAERGTEPALVTLLGRMLEKDRRLRVATWDEVLAAIPGQAPPPTAKPQAAVDPVAGPPEPEPPATIATVAARRATGPRFGWLVLAVAGAVLACAAVGWILLLPGGPLRATPETLAGILARPHPPEILLSPGTYAGPWRLGAGVAGAALRANGPGVVVRSADGPAIIAEPGLSRCTLAGIDVDGQVEVMSGSELTMDAVRIQGGLRIDGGQLQLHGVDIEGEVAVTGTSRLKAEGSRFHGGIAASQAVVELRDSRIAAPTGAAALRIDGGRLDLSGVRIRSASDAILLVGVDEVRLNEVAATATGTALHAADSALTQVAGLDLTGRTGLRWQGRRDAAWAWSRIRIDAAEPLMGISGLAVDGQGAQRDRLPADW